MTTAVSILAGIITVAAFISSVSNIVTALRIGNAMLRSELAIERLRHELTDLVRSEVGDVRRELVEVLREMDTRTLPLQSSRLQATRNLQS